MNAGSGPATVVDADPAPGVSTGELTPPALSGIAAMAQAAFWFAVMGLLVKMTGEQLPTAQIVFGRGCVTMTLSVVLLWRARISPFRGRPHLLLLRGFFGSTALMCSYAALVHMPLAEATVIQQTAPLYTALLAAWLLGERLHARILVSIATCFVGVLAIARPAALFGEGLAQPFPWLYALLAVMGAALSALAYVTVRKLGRQHPPLVVVFFFPLVTVPLSAPFAIAQWVPPDTRGWLLLVAIGVVTQLGQMALTKGLAREPAGRATTVGYLQIAFATGFGAIVFGALPDALSWLGMALIVLGLLFGLRRTRAAPGNPVRSTAGTR